MRLFKPHNSLETIAHTGYKIRDREQELLVRYTVNLREKQELGLSQIRCLVTSL